VNVLFIGGPLDGVERELPEGTPWYDVEQLSKFRLSDYATVDNLPVKRVRYYRHHLTVGPQPFIEFDVMVSLSGAEATRVLDGLVQSLVAVRLLATMHWT